MLSESEYTFLSCIKEIEIRVEKWIQTLVRVPKHHEVMVKERNMYARLLLHMIFIKDLIFPFDKSPDNSSLPPFPESLKSRVKHTVGIHESTFWRDIYSNVHPCDDIITYSELERQLELNKTQMEAQLCNARDIITELSSRIQALESTCSKICDMINDSKDMSPDGSNSHYAHWIVATMTHYEQYKKLFEGLLKIEPNSLGRHEQTASCPSCVLLQHTAPHWSDADGGSLSTIGHLCEDVDQEGLNVDDVFADENRVVPLSSDLNRSNREGLSRVRSEPVKTGDNTRYERESKLQDLISRQKDVYIDELLNQLQIMDKGYSSIISNLQGEMSDQKLHYRNCVDMLQEKIKCLNEDLTAAVQVGHTLTEENRVLRESIADLQKKHSSQSIYCEALLSTVAALRHKAEQQASRADTAGTLQNILVHSIECMRTSDGRSGNFQLDPSDSESPDRFAPLHDQHPRCIG